MAMSEAMGSEAKGLRLIILAAGRGTRMRTSQAKAMCLLGGAPLLEHVLDAMSGVSSRAPLVVVGHEAESVRAHFAGDKYGIEWRNQEKALGTGDAVRCALDDVGDDERVAVLYADVPLLRAETVERLAGVLKGGDGDAGDAEGADVAFLTTKPDNPYGYGRVVRDAEGAVVRIVEQADLGEEHADIDEVNTGVLAAYGRHLKSLVGKLGCDNAQGEYYLTDCIRLAVEGGLRVRAVVLDDGVQALGVNTAAELHRAERRLYRRRADELMEGGVVVHDAERLDVRGTVSAGSDVEIDVGVILEGEVRLGDGVRIGAHCVLKNVEIGDGTEVKPMTLMEGARTGRECVVGPFARIRPETVLDDGAMIGNYVEVKNSRIGGESKAGHLSYIGDTTLGAKVNVGAGVITCNYDGARKHPTEIGDRVFIGSGTQLVAPITIGDDATIGAGSTLTRDAASGGLTLSRVVQKTVKGWKRKVKGGD